MKTFLLAAVAASTMLIGSGANAAIVFVGSYQVDDGPNWNSNPTVYSATEAAALLFGGVASDYDISTVSNQVADIDNMGWYTIWGISGGTKFNEDYKLDLGGPGYDDPGGDNTAISAYTDDNAIGSQYTNYVFRVDGQGGAVPEPATWAMMVSGFGAAGSVIRRRKAVVA